MLPNTFTMIATIIIVVALTLVGVSSVPEADKISTLPGQPPVKFEQYSGYITVDEQQQRALFYYFVEAEDDPASKPLVLWLEGGPGCSSLIGAFVEHGPFKPGDNLLVKNDYSWNKEANMLYLESPAGVGFSYSSNTSFYDLVTDEITARDNLVFLQRWFTEFPQYSNNDFFISGSSYAGHYVPQLAQLIVETKTKFNLKGIAMGNPLLEFNTDFNSKAEFLWSHGLIADETYEVFTRACNYSTIYRITQIQNRNLSGVCARVNKLVFTEVNKYTDTYDVTLDVCLSSVDQQAYVLNNLQGTEKIDVCAQDKTMTYLNRKEVQKALHAKLVGVTKWSACSGVVHYDYENFEIPTIPILGSLVKSGIRILVFSGDQDSVIPLLGSRSLINGLGKELGLNTTVAYRAWFERKQVAGWTQVYGDILSYATIRGASHLPPYTQPERSLVLFKAFLEGKSLPTII
ncbi:serine carboxypeptidase-like 45 [Gastrolobium bilobum]|uniref:serine carboxypeptidase-like 45 n=1 Tax=Gastrolobium bilobum TaxID=150636 RepID=UPI002AB20AFC|nr:serine carboxypeptidase-like 45 [Gastrolobium bilobum]